jgi:hypothetical protein
MEAAPQLTRSLLRRLPRLLLVVAIGLFVLIGLLLSPILFCVALNEFRLYWFASQLSRLPLPQYAEIIASESDVGNISGSNSDHCSYRAVIVVKVSLSYADVLKFRQRVEEMTFNPAEWGSLIRPRATISQTDEDHFKIVLEDNDYQPNLDPRCW